MPWKGPDFDAIIHHFRSDDIQKLSKSFEPKVQRVIRDLEASAHVGLYTKNLQNQWSMLHGFDTAFQDQSSQLPEGTGSLTQMSEVGGCNDPMNNHNPFDNHHSQVPISNIIEPQISQAMSEAADSVSSNITSLTGTYGCDVPAV